MSESGTAAATLKGPVIERIPHGDDRVRFVCNDCGFINYINPRIVTAAVPVWDGKFLLARRAINPRKGFWTVPAGFLEVGETIAAGAVRETWEEVRAHIKTNALLGIYNIAAIGQVYMVYRAEMLSGEFGVGPESIESKLFTWDDIPWADLAFPSVRWALQDYRKVEGQDTFAPFAEPASFHWER
ncbi:MAG: NUDIX hydrolase [Rhodospirillaceae bacterium]|nr:NUDIX hydrolase [Rhodospirillaceae bacterium]